MERVDKKIAVKVEIEFEDGSTQTLNGASAEEFMKIERTTGANYILRGGKIPVLPWENSAKVDDDKEVEAFMGDGYVEVKAINKLLKSRNLKLKKRKNKQKKYGDAVYLKLEKI